MTRNKKPYTLPPANKPRCRRTPQRPRIPVGHPEQREGSGVSGRDPARRQGQASSVVAAPSHGACSGYLFVGTGPCACPPTFRPPGPRPVPPCHPNVFVGRHLMPPPTSLFCKTPSAPGLIAPILIRCSRAISWCLFRIFICRDRPLCLPSDLQATPPHFSQIPHQDRGYSLPQVLNLGQASLPTNPGPIFACSVFT